jgi:class 3 adenylate cyclase/GGDEF domain-containing protein
MTEKRAQQPGGSLDKAVMSILFSDIRNYTQMSKSLDSSQLQGLLDPYLQEMGRIVEAHHGVIEKILGDGILAFFKGSPASPEHASAAVEAALEMHHATSSLRRNWQSLGGAIDLQLRMGVASGDVLEGDLRVSTHTKYTALGDAVNLASRLQEQASPGGLLIAQSTWTQLPNAYQAQRIEGLELKGFEDAYTAYEILGRAPSHPAPQPPQTSRPKNTQEQRRSPRQHLTIDLRYSTNERDFVARTQNISEGGVFIESSTLHPLGTPLTIHSDIPTERGFLPINLVGSVVRHATAHSEHGMGVEFSRVETGALNTTHYFVNAAYQLAHTSRPSSTSPAPSDSTASLPLDHKPDPIPSHALDCKDAADLSARLGHEFHRTKRYNHEFSCVSIRVGQLPKGAAHTLGQQALAVIAEQIQGSIRNTDEVFYLREGLFVVLAPETMANRIHTLTKRIMGKIHHQIRIKRPEFNTLDVHSGTFSFDGRNAQDHNEILRNTLNACN